MPISHESWVPAPTGIDLEALVESLVEEAMGSCEPENADETASTYSRKVLRHKFGVVLKRGFAQSRALAASKDEQIAGMRARHMTSPNEKAVEAAGEMVSVPRRLAKWIRGRLYYHGDSVQAGMLSLYLSDAPTPRAPGDVGEVVIGDLAEKLERAAISVGHIEYDENICVLHWGENVTDILQEASKAITRLSASLAELESDCERYGKSLGRAYAENDKQRLQIAYLEVNLSRANASLAEAEAKGEIYERALTTLAEHNGICSDFPHEADRMADFARAALEPTP